MAALAALAGGYILLRSSASVRGAILRRNLLLTDGKVFPIRSPHPVPLDGVKLMTMISMEQEAVPAGLPTTYRQALGATRYRRAGTMTGWLNRKHRLLVGTLARRGPA